MCDGKCQATISVGGITGLGLQKKKKKVSASGGPHPANAFM